MNRGMLVAAALLLPVPLSSTAGGQESCRQRSVPVNVLDENGDQVWGLKGKDFRAEFRGTAAKILSVARDANQRRIAVILDVSGSMKEESRWRLARDAVGDIASYAPANMELALVRFAEEAEEAVSFREGREAIGGKLAWINDRLQQIAAEKNTALIDGIFAGIKLLGSTSIGDAVYIITDGGNYESKAKPEELAEAARKANVRVYGLFFEWKFPRQREKVMWGVPGLPYVKELIRATGGSYLSIPPTGGVLYDVRWYELSDDQRAAVALGARRMYARMAEFYRMELELPATVDKEREWELAVVDERGKKRRGLTVLYPQTLWPCADRRE